MSSFSPLFPFFECFPHFWVVLSIFVGFLVHEGPLVLEYVEQKNIWSSAESMEGLEDMCSHNFENMMTCKGQKSAAEQSLVKHSSLQRTLCLMRLCRKTTPQCSLPGSTSVALTPLPLLVLHQFILRGAEEHQEVGQNLISQEYPFLSRRLAVVCHSTSSGGIRKDFLISMDSKGHPLARH